MKNFVSISLLFSLLAIFKSYAGAIITGFPDETGAPDAALQTPGPAAFLQPKIATGAQVSNILPLPAMDMVNDSLGASPEDLNQVPLSAKPNSVNPSATVVIVVTTSTNNAKTSSDASSSQVALSEPPASSNPCSSEGQSTCSAEGESILYKCTAGNWAKVVCGSNTVCKMKSNTEAVCLDPNVPVPKDESNVAIKDPCTSEGHSTCSAEGEGIFYKCSEGFWSQEKCGPNTVCKMKSSYEAVCLDPNTKLPSKNSTDTTKDPCQIEGQTKCSSTDKNGYLMCNSGYWQTQTCSDQNICKLDKGGKVICVSKDDKRAKSTPCKKNGESRCASGTKNVYQNCIDNEWQSFTCDGANECGTKDGKIICYNPKDSIQNIVLDPCEVEDQLRCYIPVPSMYQKCTNKNWANMTCNDGTFCENIFTKNTIGCFDSATKNRDSNGTIIIPDKPQLSLASKYSPTPEILYFILSYVLFYSV